MGISNAGGGSWQSIDSLDPPWLWLALGLVLGMEWIGSAPVVRPIAGPRIIGSPWPLSAQRHICVLGIAGLLLQFRLVMRLVTHICRANLIAVLYDPSDINVHVGLHLRHIWLVNGSIVEMAVVSGSGLSSVMAG